MIEKETTNNKSVLNSYTDNNSNTLDNLDLSIIDMIKLKSKIDLEKLKNITLSEQKILNFIKNFIDETFDYGNDALVLNLTSENKDKIKSIIYDLYFLIKERYNQDYANKLLYENPTNNLIITFTKIDENKTVKIKEILIKNNNELE